MSIRVFHIYQPSNTGKFRSPTLSQSDSALEKQVKLVLNHALKLSQVKTNEVSQLPENVFNSD